MSHPGPIFRPFEKLVKITVKGREYEVPDSNTLLRAFQYLAPDTVPYGRFCWNEECQYCRLSYDMGEGTSTRLGLSCKIMVQPGMRVLELAAELRYCLRELPEGK
ncbi:MAG TPA: 2Fe-2S iron-sulfur cluster-binding protein [Terriglobales bacterium]|nr:2Fe-2S iron-sulfur cluster-binding protein [Terriglobales bacterium]